MAISSRVYRTLGRGTDVKNRTGLAVGLGAASVSFLAYLLSRNQMRGQRRTLGKKVKDIMTKDPVHCSRDTRLPDVAKMMVEHDCGEIPVVDSNGTPVGVITDRDIVCRTIAKGINPLNMSAESTMTTHVKTVLQNATFDECLRLMEQNQIRRILVVDEQGFLRGVVSQADIARLATRRQAAQVIEKISQPSAA